jgi:hypothetical protein
VNLENGKWYKNWKEVCTALDINYKKSTGDAKKKTIKDLELEYKITKNGYKMKFDKLSTDIVKENKEKLEADNIISSRTSFASKLFSVEFLEYITDVVESGKYENSINLNMYGLLKEMNILNTNHKEVNYYLNGKDNELANVRKTVKDMYYDKYYSDLVRLYERAMDNLVKKEMIYYEKRHNISYSVFGKSKELKDEFSNLTQIQIDTLIDNGTDEETFYNITDKVIREENHKMTSTREENIVRNAERDAWECIKNLFDLGSIQYSDDEKYHINFFLMFHDGCNAKYSKMRDNIDINSIAARERELVNMFFDRDNYTLYTLFRDLSKMYTGDLLEITDMNGYEYEVDTYYKAYNIMVAENLFKKYSQQMIKTILLENEDKDANADYMIKRMYKGLNEDHYDKAILLEDIVKVCSYVSPKPSDLNEMNKHYQELFEIEGIKIDADIPLELKENIK